MIDEIGADGLECRPSSKATLSLVPTPSAELDEDRGFLNFCRSGRRNRAPKPPDTAQDITIKGLLRQVHLMRSLARSPREMSTPVSAYVTRLRRFGTPPEVGLCHGRLSSGGWRRARRPWTAWIWAWILRALCGLFIPAGRCGNIRVEAGDREFPVGFRIWFPKTICVGKVDSSRVGAGEL